MAKTTVPPIYWEDVEFQRLTGKSTQALSAPFFRSEQIKGFLQGLKAGRWSPWSSYAIQLASDVRAMVAAGVPRTYVDTLWLRGMSLANVGGLPVRFDDWKRQAGTLDPSTWTTFTGTAPSMAPDPGVVDTSLFPPYTVSADPTPSGIPDCLGTYPSRAGQRCFWPHPQGNGALVTLNGPPGPLSRSVFPMPPGYVPSPETGEGVAATDDLWKLYWPSAGGAPSGTTPLSGAIAPTADTPLIEAPGDVAVVPPIVAPPGTGGYYPGATSQVPNVAGPLPNGGFIPAPVPVPTAALPPAPSGAAAPTPVDAPTPVTPVSRGLALLLIGGILYIIFGSRS